jgi:hypothetical protein
MVPQSAFKSDDTNVTETCVELQSYHDEDKLPTSTEMCMLAKEVTFACPIFCGYDVNIITSYLGTDTEAKKKALVWMSRVNGLVSLFGASFILIDILRSKRKRFTTLHQLLFGMALFDLSTGGAWAFASAPLPADEAFYVYGARGTTSQTCTAQ